MQRSVRALGATAMAWLLLLGSAGGRADAAVLYQQQPLGSDSFMFGLNSVLNGQVIYEDFMLTAGASITGLNWSGAYQSTTLPTAAPVSFEVSFYDNQGGLPGALLMKEAVTILGTVTGTSPNQNYPILSYNLALASPLIRLAGAATWVSIVETDPTTNIMWMWEFSKILDGNRVAYRNGPAGTLQLSFNDYDVAFSLTGTELAIAAAPEPSAFALAGIGAVLILAARRRRHSRAIG